MILNFSDSILNFLREILWNHLTCSGPELPNGRDQDDQPKQPLNRLEQQTTCTLRDSFTRFHRTTALWRQLWPWFCTAPKSQPWDLNLSWSFEPRETKLKGTNKETGISVAMATANGCLFFWIAFASNLLHILICETGSIHKHSLSVWFWVPYHSARESKLLPFLATKDNIRVCTYTLSASIFLFESCLRHWSWIPPNTAGHNVCQWELSRSILWSLGSAAAESKRRWKQV